MLAEDQSPTRWPSARRPQNAVEAGVHTERADRSRATHEAPRAAESTKAAYSTEPVVAPKTNHGANTKQALDAHKTAIATRSVSPTRPHTVIRYQAESVQSSGRRESGQVEHRIGAVDHPEPQPRPAQHTRAAPVRPSQQHLADLARAQNEPSPESAHDRPSLASADPDQERRSMTHAQPHQEPSPG